LPEITNVQFAAALRALAETYEQHPEMARPEHLDFYVTNAPREAFAAAVKALGACKKLPPSYRDDAFFTVEFSVSGVPVRLHVWRTTVCRKVQVMKMVDDWDCTDPILEALVPEAVA
jgi:hypothetical protein